ncbi:MAG: cupin domain-containing protein [Pseudomonadota bacterium]
MRQRVYNLLDGLPNAASKEITEVLLSSPNVRLERIVSRGQASPKDFWYDQNQAEWVMLLAGRARLAIEQDEHEHDLGPGDSLYLPAHCRHRVAWTDPAQDTVWLALFVDADDTSISHEGPATS